jgi:hypothetical protein
MNAPLSLPVIKVAHAKSGASGELAGIADAAASAAKKRLTSISVNDDALRAAIEAVAATAARIEQAVPLSVPFSLSSFEVSLGITASGAVGILGTGVDVECEATFTLSFERISDPKV